MTKKPSAPPLPSLTGIRGVAAVWVVAFHMCDFYRPHLPIIRDGFRAVDLFFILSGFIMMHVHHLDFPVIRWRSTARFFTLRVLRIYPLSTVVLLMILLYVLKYPAFVTFVRNSSPDVANSFSRLGFFQTLLLANRWFLPDFGPWNGVAWSLSVELLAYLTFPVAAFLLARETSARRCAIYAFGVLALLIAYLAATGRAEINAIGTNGIIRGVAGFISGAAMYRFCQLRGDSEANANRARIVGIVSCMVLLALLLIPHAAVLAPICFAALIGSLYFQRGSVNAFLANRMCVFLGAISFSLYLIHFVPLQALHWQIVSGNLAQGGSGLLRDFIFYFAAVLLVAWVLHRLVERPAHKLARRIITRRQSAANVSQVA